MTVLYLDCFSGASGDMLLGALIDAGVPLSAVREALGSLALNPEDVWVDRVLRAGVQATKFCVRGEDAHEHDHAHGAGTEGHRHPHDHAHDHHHEGHAHPHAHAHGNGPGAHAHRTLAEIAALIDSSRLSASGKARAKALFTRLGEVEAAIHGTTLEHVHLHEVGALDSIVDIVGTVFALEYLGAGEVVASPLNVGSGTIAAAHGLYPVPAPATLRLLQGVPVYAGEQRVELVTPTGALLVSGYASRYGPMPAMRPSVIGYGAGARDFPHTPNVLRVVLGESDAPRTTETVAVLESEIDDMSPQIFGMLMDRLLEAGALDVFYTSVQMKKNRPGTLLTIVAPPSRRDALTAIVFRETTTLGVRHCEMRRECLEREERVVRTALGDVRVKVARRQGAVLNASPEFEDVLRVARAHDRPVKDVHALAMQAFLAGTNDPADVAR